MSFKDVHVPRPRICPICKDDMVAMVKVMGGDPYGTPRLYLIEDENLEAGWVILKGWTCINRRSQSVLFGTVVRHGTPEGPQDIQSPDHSYIARLPGRTVVPL